jgi:DNA-binding response OmpR family regulator
MFSFFRKKKRARLLIVDDEQPLVATLRDRLEMAGYEVLTAANGREGLAAAIAESPDLILLDTMMPDMDGHEMLEHLRENPASRDISVIMVTACNLIEDINRADRFGVDEYVVKPFNAHDLMGKIETILERKGVIAART